MGAHAPAFELRLALVVEGLDEVVDFLGDGGAVGGREDRGIGRRCAATELDPPGDGAARLKGVGIDHEAAARVLCDALGQAHRVGAF